MKASNIFNYNFLYTAYADDINFFIKRYKFCNRNHENILLFSLLSGLSFNKAKREIVGIGVMKGVKLVLCGMKCVSTSSNVIKRFGICYSYDKKLVN